MRLRDHLRADLVFADLDAPDRSAALDRIAGFLAEREPSLDRTRVRDALEKREEAHSTAMGHGLALPHATVQGLDETLLAVALARLPVKFGGDDEGVRLFFILLSPPGSEGTHIKLLARICRLVRIPGVTDDLLSADSADGVARAILRHDDEHV